MDPHHQDIFVVGAIEERDAAQGRSDAMGAPQEVVGQLVGCGNLERLDATASGIEPGHHVRDCAVFPGGVKAL